MLSRLSSSTLRTSIRLAAARSAPALSSARKAPALPLNLTLVARNFTRSTMAPTKVKVGAIDLLKDGEMKEIPFPSEDSESKILLTKVKGQYFANSNKCTHYGAPLVKGVLTESGRITCPWHGACFSASPGEVSLSSLWSRVADPLDSSHLHPTL